MSEIDFRLYQFQGCKLNEKRETGNMKNLQVTFDSTINWSFEPTGDLQTALCIRCNTSLLDFANVYLQRNKNHIPTSGL